MNEETVVLSSFSDESGAYWLFWCPGCSTHHAPRKNRWSLTGSMSSPTLHPSVVSIYGTYKRCHLFVKDGNLVYLNDCTHKFAGMTIPLEPLP